MSMKPIFHSVLFLSFFLRFSLQMKLICPDSKRIIYICVTYVAYRTLQVYNFFLFSFSLCGDTLADI